MTHGHRGSTRLAAFVVAFSSALTLVAIADVPSASAAGPCGPPVVNPVACENTLPGDAPSDWQVNGAGDSTIQGFGTSMSVNAGQTISFKIKTPASSYHFDILRLGYYQGNGARKLASGLRPSASLPQNQPACLTNSTTGLIDCGNWGVSASWTVPSNAVSGIYIAHLVRDDTGGDSQIVFVVRNDASHSNILLQTSDATWEAYNDYGGNSLYTCAVACPPGSPAAYKGAYAVSYNRPFDGAANDGGASFLYYAEYQMIRFMEQNGYDVSYTSGSDVESRGALLKNHKVFMNSGHDEYWSAGQRANVTAARDAGVNLAFFSGNEIFWKTRWAASGDGTNTPLRTIVSYKETHFDAPTDPQDPTTWTGTWRDPRFSPPADGGLPENALTGQYFAVNSGTSDITVPAQYSKLRLWRNTAVAKLNPGQSYTLSPGTGTLGYEWDLNVDNGFQPAGLFNLSSTTVSGTQIFSDYGSTTTIGTSTHHLTLYRAPSGALVFGAGTVQWSWGLDNTNAWSSSTTDPSGNPPDPNMQQATVNLFADMGAQPATLMSGLVSASSTTDATAPTSTISSPARGASVQDGSTVTVSGTSADAGGGVVAGVEVSTDGKTWHPASGTTNWTYAWTAHGTPTATIRVRAVDDSGNLEAPGGGVSVSVTCPCSIWGNAITPPTPDAGDPTSVEVGVKFKSDSLGQVSGIRFYKASANTGTHIGSLWTAGGQRLASATFRGETASGWQQATFSSPVTISANTTYVASYFAPSGHYAATASYFYPAPSPPPNGGGLVDSPPLHALLNGTSPNGVYSYSASSAFPSSSYGASNYWVDPMFTPIPAPGQVTNVHATAGFNSATVSWTAPTGGGATTYTVTPYLGSVAQTPTTVTGSPPGTSATVQGLTQGSSYTFTVQASNANGSGPVSSPSNAVTPTGPAVPTAPGSVSASVATSSAFVTWTTPDNQGSPITGYTVTPYIGSAAQTPLQVNSGVATSATVTGLANGTSYTFTVSATNGLGTGPESSPSSAVTPQNTIFDFGTPATIDSGDPSSVELGVKFKADSSGTVTGIRFYKAAANTGAHTGSLWTSTGALLASATFTNESASGWQQVSFSSPVAITAGTTYVAGYSALNGHYSFTASGLSSAVDNPPLHAIANGTSPNGVYAYGAGSPFPSSSYNAANYWVDVLYAPTAPGQVTNVTATAGYQSADVSWSAPAGGGTVNTYTITPYSPGGAQTPTRITGSPPVTHATIQGLTQGTAYTFTVQASNSGGAGPASAASNSVTPTGATGPSAPQNVAASAARGAAQVNWTAPATNNGSAISSYTVTPFIGSAAQTPVQVNNAAATSANVTGLTNGTAYTFKVSATNGLGTGPASAASNIATPQSTIFDLSSPATIDSTDPSSVEVGVKFTADTSGSVTGIRFYKAAANTGTHLGSLWSSTGTLLASGTFTQEAAAGWQQMTFSSPVAITAGTTYVAGYFAPNGHYSVTGGGLSASVDNAPLHALANSSSANGVYAYSATATFPTSSYQAGNYWVDLLFSATAPGQVTNVTATAGNASASVSWSAPASGGVSAYTITPYIGSAAQTPTTTLTGSPPATSATVRGLTPGTSYTFTVQASNASGAGPASAQSNPVTPSSSTAPSAPQNVSANPATSSALVNWTAPAADGGSPITKYTVTPFVGSTAQTPIQVNNGSATSTTVTGLTNGTSYTFTVAASNSAATGPPSTASSPIKPADTIFDFAVPATIDSGDTSSLEVGVKFTADSSGSVTGVRFYKAPTNTGTHVGSLWSASGTLLASATFANETASGWQQVSFTTPVGITAGTTYVVGYFAPNGHYSDTAAGLSSAFDNPPLHAVADPASANGVYAVGTGSTFPTNSYNATNYWVDLMFVTP